MQSRMCGQMRCTLICDTATGADSSASMRSTVSNYREQSNPSYNALIIISNTYRVLRLGGQG